MSVNISFHDVNRYAIQQNNAGVNYYMAMGNFDAAQEHFRRSLASKLASENHLLVSSSTEQTYPRLCQPVDSVATDNSPIDADTLNHQRCISPDLANPISWDQLEETAGDSSEFDPYLYLRPFAILQRQDVTENSPIPNSESTLSIAMTSAASCGTTHATADSVTMSLIIIFNLALVHHTTDRTSRKAYSMYQIAITILSALPLPTDSDSLLLHVAVLNNCGVWCYENHEFDSMTIYFEEIMSMLDEASCGDDDATSSLTVAFKRGIFRNLRKLCS